MAENVCIGHAAADIQRFVGENKEFLEKDRDVVALLEAQVPPLLRGEAGVVIADDEALVAIELGEQFPAAVLAAGAEVAEVVDKVVVPDD